MSDAIDPHAWQGGTSVVLPCAPDQFQEFVVGLLGRPQTLEGHFMGSFAVTKDNIVQLYHLITQRVQQQNGVLPIQFISKIGYSDGTSIQLNSIQDFEDYVEVRNVVSDAITISLVYVIGFPGKSVPERQEVDVSFKYSSDRSGVDYRINHTARTWGSDIESLLRNYIEGILKRRHPVREFFAGCAGRMGVAAGIVLMILFLVGMSLTFQHVTEYQLNSLQFALGANATMALKLDTALRMLASGVWQKFSVASLIYCLCAIIISIVGGALVGSFLGEAVPSAVLLTPLAKESYDKRDRTFSREFWNFMATCLVSIFIGLLTNYVYDAYCKNIMIDNLEIGGKKGS